jgi:hypothetical protein
VRITYATDSGSGTVRMLAPVFGATPAWPRTGLGPQLVRDVQHLPLEVDVVDGQAEDLPHPQPAARPRVSWNSPLS